MHEYWRAISRRDVLRAELIERRGARLQLGAREGRLFTPSRREQVARAAARRARVPRAGRARLPTRAEHQAQPGLLVHLPVEQLPLPRRYRAGDDGARRRAALLVRLLRHPLRQRQGGGGRLGRPARRRAGGRFGPPRPTAPPLQRPSRRPARRWWRCRGRTSAASRRWLPSRRPSPPTRGGARPRRRGCLIEAAPRREAASSCPAHVHNKNQIKLIYYFIF